MSVTTIQDCETAFDLGNNNALGTSGGSVTVVAGALRAGATNTNHLHHDMSTAAAGGVYTTQGGTAGASATKSIACGTVTITHDTGTNFDTPIAKGFKAGSALQWEIRDSRLTDGKIHFYVGGTEVDSGNAFAPAVGTPIAFYVEIGLNSPYPCKLYYDSTAGGTLVLKQSANAAGATGAVVQLSLGETLGKGVDHNWQLDSENWYAMDDGGSFSNTLPDPTVTDLTLATHAYKEVVREGVPNADTGTNGTGWQNVAGAACSLGSSSCFEEVNDVPLSDTTYIKWVGDAAGGSALDYETFPTTTLKIGASDLVSAMAVGLRGRLVTIPGSDVLLGAMRYSGSGVTWSPTWNTVSVRWGIGFTLQNSAPGSVAWTPTVAKATEVGACGFATSVTVGGDMRITEAYKIVLYKPVVAAVTRRRVHVI